jgi:delta-lactam-biosynthetic de-N-acetylase
MCLLAALILAACWQEEFTTVGGSNTLSFAPSDTVMPPTWFTTTTPVVPPTSTAPTVPTQTTAPTVPTTAPTTPPQDEFLKVTYTPKVENNGETYTGLPPLPALDYLVMDPENTRQLSTKRIDHSFGVASNGVPHWITVDNQKRFDEWGTGALAWDNISKEKVLYLTFDCGYEYQNLTSQMLDTLKAKNVQATFFVTMGYLRSAPQVTARMIAEGHHVGNHSFSHPADCAALSREQMALEALAVENHLRVNFGYTAKYFRFPAGVYSENAVEILNSVGYRSVFWSIAYADWDPENQIGADKAMQTLKDRLHPGAVILLHSTSPDNAQILGDFIDYAIAQGYRFANLDEYPGWKTAE